MIIKAGFLSASLLLAAAPGCPLIDADDLKPKDDIDLQVTFDGSSSNTGGGPCADNGVSYDEPATFDIDENVSVIDYEITGWTLASTATGTGVMGYIDYGLYQVDTDPIIVAGAENCGTNVVSVSDQATANVCLGNLVTVLNEDSGVKDALLESINEGALNAHGVGQCSGDFTVTWEATLDVTATVQVD